MEELSAMPDQSRDHSAAERRAAIERAVFDILVMIGEDPEREGLRETPQRVARMYDEILAGYHLDLRQQVNGAVFDVTSSEIVVVKDIDYDSLCEHHMLPFWGEAHIAYMPKEKIIGLSKISRIVDVFAKRLQIQERLTQQIATAIDDIIVPHGCVVVIEAAHMCCTMRGVKKANTRMRTLVTTGVFKTDEGKRNEALFLLRSQLT